ncbi:MAG: PHP domain-containing protein [Dehalococcoidia bacterium]|nr:PHP domain-containing protein [Dehalococcoidia bacterium]
MLKADLHLHTSFSPDSSVTVEQVIETCRERGINCIAVTDHGSIEGALKIKEMAPFKVIVGEEILTAEGELIGFFLTEKVPGGLTLEETIDKIKEQGGLVCVPHPFDRMRFSAIEREGLYRITPKIDALEVFNARTPLYYDSEQASAYAHRHGLPATSGSDAHSIREIGNAYVEIPDFNGPEEFLKSLRQGRVNGQRSSFTVHMASTRSKLAAKIKRGASRVWHRLVFKRAR